MRIVFMGTSPFACGPIRRMVEVGLDVVGVVTQPDRPKGRGRKLQPTPAKEQALVAGLDVLQPANVNARASVDALARMEPDLIVVAAYGQILRRRLLALAHVGAVNLHASLLPKYRGAAPINWAIADGCRETGVTLMRMAPTVDTGAMLAKRALAIGPQETAPELETRLSELAADLLVDALPGLADGSLQAIPQDDREASAAPRLTKADGHINWRRAAGQIGCQIRAMQPWPMAHTFLYHRGRMPGQRLILRRGRPVIVWPGGGGGPPGAVLALADGQMVVQAGVGALAVTEVQPAGRRSMPVDAFARGHAVAPGDVLGPEHA